MAFIPTTRDEMDLRGWSELDVIFISGDAYIDHPSFGLPLLARWLEKHGFRTGIIAQPDWQSAAPFAELGPPNLFVGVTAGNPNLNPQQAWVSEAAVDLYGEQIGGRLDATNVIDARVVLLTNVGLEHTEVLGDTR